MNLMPRKWPLWLYIIIATLVVSLISSFYMRIHYSEQLWKNFRQQQQQNINLLQVVLIASLKNAEFSELTAIIDILTKHNEHILKVTIQSAEHKQLFTWHRSDSAGEIDESNKLGFEHALNEKGTTSGYLYIESDKRLIQKYINQQLWLMQVYLFSSLLSLSLIVLIILQRKVINPVWRISRLLKKVSLSTIQTPSKLHVSEELDNLSDSVNEFAIAIKNKKKSDDELEKVRKHILHLSYQHELILNSAGEGMFGVDANGCTTFMNPQAIKILGWNTTDMLGKKYHGFIQHSDQKGLAVNEVDTSINKTLREGVIYEINDDVFWSKDNRVIAVEYVSAPIIESTEITGAVIVFRDITDRKDTENDLYLALRQAKNANMAKAEFLAIMSHEIRTPLNVVIGANNLLMDSELSDEQRQFVQIASSSGEALLALINDILDYSKLEAGKMYLERTDFSLNYILEEMNELFLFQIKDKGLRLNINNDTSIPEVLNGDSGRLRQVLFNLMSNAIKFTTEGDIDITTRFKGHNKNQLMLEIEVADSGIGIAEDKQDQLFKKFTQIDHTYSRKYGGTGLGLAICKSIVELMEGEIHCDSVLGKGSRFIFTVKLWLGKHKKVSSQVNNGTTLSDRQPENIQRPSSNFKIYHNARRILLVEDSPSNQIVALAMLRKAGYNADAVANGREALAAIQKLPYDLILMDLAMPEMDGFEATGCIRALKNDMAFIPIIALTANAMQGDKERCLAMGMDDYLSKPLNKTILYKTLEYWLPVIEKKVSNTIQHIDGSTESNVHGDDKNMSEIISVEYTKYDNTVNKNKPLVDQKVIDQLGNDTSPELVPQMIEIFIRETENRLIVIEKAILEKDLLSLQKEAHVIKSSAGTYGSTELQSMAKKVDATSKANQQNEALDYGKKLLTLAQQTISEMKQKYTNE